MLTFIRYSLVLLICSICLVAKASTNWQPLADGIDYTNIPLNNTANGQVYAYRINLSRYHLVLANAKASGASNNADVATLAQQVHGVIAINGGFFDINNQPLGLRVQNGTLHNPLRPISWWDIFYTQHNHANIVPVSQWQLTPDINFAIQAGPRLVLNGQIPANLKTGYAARSALCIDAQNQVIIAITQNTAITLAAFATVLQQSTAQHGLGCQNALNLDGGSSSQLYAHVGDYSQLLPGINTVADAIVVVAN